MLGMTKANTKGNENRSVNRNVEHMDIVAGQINERNS
jgi:hypothetical protein